MLAVWVQNHHSLSSILHLVFFWLFLLRDQSLLKVTYFGVAYWFCQSQWSLSCCDSSRHVYAIWPWRSLLRFLRPPPCHPWSFWLWSPDIPLSLSFCLSQLLPGLFIILGLFLIHLSFLSTFYLLSPSQSLQCNHQGQAQSVLDPHLRGIIILPANHTSNPRFLEFPGGLVAKDPALSLLWHRCNPWPRNFCML